MIIIDNDDLFRELNAISEESSPRPMPNPDVKHFVVLIVLVLALMFVLTWSGVIRCSQIPYWCDAYELVMGKPRVAIIYGDDGLGNPDRLEALFNDPAQFTALPEKLYYKNINSEILKRYNLIIVTKLKTIDTKYLLLLKEYVDQGGRLVWTGDAGTGLTEADKALNGKYTAAVESTRKQAEKLGQTVLPAPELNPWRRVIEESSQDGQPYYPVLNFEEMLKVRYIGVYCELVECKNEQNPLIGKLITINDEHRFVEGISRDLNFYGNFVLTEYNPSGGNMISKIDLLTGTTIDERNYEDLPFIVSSHTDRVVYYAIPLEDLADEEDEIQGRAYKRFVRQVYLGMTK